jgi:hypothetical protein
MIIFVVVINWKRLKNFRVSVRDQVVSGTFALNIRSLMCVSASGLAYGVQTTEEETLAVRYIMILLHVLLLL